MIFCCLDFERLYKNKKLRIRYEDYLRSFGLKLPGGGGYQTLFYCFCCGKKFPKDLWEEWYRVLTEEYNIKDPWDDEYEAQIPSEFLTDEWWKKRGL